MNSAFASQRPACAQARHLVGGIHPRARPHASARPSVRPPSELRVEVARKHRCGAQPRRAAAPPQPTQQPPSLPTREMAKKAKKAPEEEAPKKGKKKAAAKK